MYVLVKIPRIYTFGLILVRRNLLFMLIRAAEYVFTIETASFKPKSLKKLHGKNITISMFLTRTAVEPMAMFLFLKI